jgi:cell division cycle 20-like protein 1, cofactor of APC complex
VVRTFNNHDLRISALAWNGSILSSGSRDRMIYSNDLRMRNSVVREHKGHKQEICGLKWSPDGS